MERLVVMELDPKIEMMGIGDELIIFNSLYYDENEDMPIVKP